KKGGDGRRKAKRKGKRADTAERVDSMEKVAGLIAQGKTRGAILKAVVEQFQITRRQAKNYYRHAQNLLVRWSGQDRKQHFVEAASFYRAVIQSAGPTWSEKIKARQCLDTLYGLGAPTEIRLSGKHDGPITIRDTEVVRPVTPHTETQPGP